MAEAAPRPRIRRRRIVERRRLEHALDRSRARARTLVAGPGYGKTVLLEQWAARDGRRIAWYRARTSAADVAVVARALQAATSSIVPDAGRRMLERLSVTEDPEREAVLLGEMLAEDLMSWPDDAWVLIDDYRHLAVAEGPERFVEVLATRSPLQVLLAARERPIWVDGKAILYGDVLEVTQAMLALTTEEADEVLEGGRLDLSSGLLTLAGGWPAVIGLAGMAPDVTEIDADADVPETLFDFFAEEVHRGLEPELSSALSLLAALPLIDRELASLVLGPERAARVCEEALQLGILDDRDDRLELHPLAAAPGVPRLESPAEVLDVYTARHDWDSAIELVQRQHLLGSIPVVLRPAVSDLVRGGRLRGVEEWLVLARQKGLNSPEISLVEAEASLRHGRHLSALTAARALLAGDGLDDTVRYRALLVGARAAHVGSLEDEAARYYEEAARVAPNGASEREAKWGYAMCLSALENSDSNVLVEELAQSSPPSDAADQVRAVDKQFSVGFRFGRVQDVADGRRVAELVDHVGDPFSRCSFRSMFSWALVLTAHYAEAHVQAEALLADATQYRVDPAAVYGHSTAAAALAGLRRFGAGVEAVEASGYAATRINDENGIQNAYAIRTRILIQMGEVAEACATEPPSVARALPSMRGEVLASRALALATHGRLAEAARLADEALSSTSGVEAQSLAAVARFLVALKARTDDVRTACFGCDRPGVHVWGRRCARGWLPQQSRCARGVDRDSRRP